jgi:hypothetical protein
MCISLTIIIAHPFQQVENLLARRGDKGKIAKVHKIPWGANALPGRVFYTCVHNGWTRA